MKRIAVVSFLVAGTVALSTCNDPKDASENNFKAVAQQYLDSTHPACYFQTTLSGKETRYLYRIKKKTLNQLMMLYIC